MIKLFLLPLPLVLARPINGMKKCVDGKIYIFNVATNTSFYTGDCCQGFSETSPSVCIEGCIQSACANTVLAPCPNVDPSVLKLPGHWHGASTVCRTWASERIHRRSLFSVARPPKHSIDIVQHSFPTFAVPRFAVAMGLLLFLWVLIAIFSLVIAYITMSRRRRNALLARDEDEDAEQEMRDKYGDATSCRSHSEII